MHRLLARQIRKHLDPTAPIPPQWQALLDAVSAAYEQADADRALLERSMEIASQELLERNQRLQSVIEDLSATEQQLRATLESTADGILVVDGQGRVANCNGKFLQMWRIPAELAAQGDDDKLLSFVLEQLKDPQAFLTKVRELYNDNQSTSLDILEFRDGRVFERYSQPAQLGSRGVGRVWSFRDVTQLRQATTAAEAANRAKSEFLANMSHEIRTPMTAILGFADLLRDPAASPADRANWIETIRRNGHHLLAILNDILDISKIEAGQMTVERIVCDLRQIIDEVVGMMQERAAAKALTLAVEWRQNVPRTICSDPTRLRQILINLLGNAIKFTGSGSVRLVLRGGDADDAHLFIDVIDTGIGMSAQEISRLFQPFTQADASTTRRFGGTGLGLVISKRLAQMLGGDLTVCSVPGRGSTFTLSLSTGGESVACATAQPADSIPVAEEAGALRGTRVLLAEDGVDNRRLIEFHLSRAGAHVTVADNGVEACRLAWDALEKGQPFHVILMDMQMPRMDGYQATAHLRAAGYRLPIIALTAHVMSGDREKCLAAGCDEFLGKPIERKMLLATVAYAARNLSGVAGCSPAMVSAASS